MPLLRWHRDAEQECRWLQSQAAHVVVGLPELLRLLDLVVVLEVLCDECETEVSIEAIEENIRRELLLTIGSR